MAEPSLLMHALLGAGSAILAGTTLKMVGWLKGKWMRMKAKEEDIELLFGFLRNAHINIGEKNPWIEWEIPPDDRDSLKLFKGWMSHYFKENRKIEYLDFSLGPPNPNLDLCSISGPVNHQLTRLGMGYDEKGESWIPILPYYYPLKEAEASQVFAMRVFKGKKWRNPNWYIADRNGKRIWTPEKDAKGILWKDYFMLIVTPNIFTEYAHRSGKKHMMIACAHGLAQLAIKDIFNDNRILSWLREGSRKTGYYQAIIEVVGKMHKGNEYVPAILNPLEIKPLDPDDFQTLSKKRGWIR
jgi:hypothetical protein